MTPLTTDDQLQQALRRLIHDEVMDEASRPIEPAEREALESLILAQVGPTATDGIVVAMQRARRRRRLSTAASVITGFAMAAGLLLYLGDRFERPPLGDLPLYAMRVEAPPDRDQRGPAPVTPAALTLRAGVPVRVELRPQRRVADQAVGARAFLRRAGDDRWLMPTQAAELSPGGAFQLHLTPDATLAAGAWELVVFVGEPRLLPMDAASAVHTTAGPRLERLTASASVL